MRSLKFLIVLLILFIILICFCKIEKPSMPEYQVIMELPILNEIYDMEDLKEEEEDIYRSYTAESSL